MPAINYRDDSYTLISIDPGGDTGIAMFVVRRGNVRLVAEHTYNWERESGKLVEDLASFTWAAHIVGHHNVALLIEKFTVTGGGVVPDLTPLKVTGAIEAEHSKWKRKHGDYLRRREFPLPEIQWAVPAQMRAISDEMVTLFATRTRDKATRHSKDAGRHGIQFLANWGHPFVKKTLIENRPR